MVKVDGHDDPDLGLATEVGFVATNESIPFIVRGSYRIERFDFPGGTSGRVEQFDQLSILVGLRLGN